MRPRRPLLLLAVLALLACLAAGCGSGGSLSLDPVADAATKTAAEQTFRFDFSMDMSIQKQALSFTGTGAFDGARQAAQITLDLSSLPLPGVVPDKTATIVYADRAMYMKFPFATGKLPGGKQWVKVDLGKAAAAAGVDLGSFDNFDPKQGLQQLLASGKTTKVGTETIDGVETTQYHATIDLANAAKLSGADRKKLQKLLKGMNGQLPVDVWIDNDGRVRRESMTFDFGGGLLNAHASMVMNFTDFGAPVEVTVPPAGQVSDLSSALAGSKRTK